MEFECDKMSSSSETCSPERKRALNKVISTQKKLRRTEDLFQFLSNSTTEPNAKTVKSIHSSKTRKNLFLPKIADTSKVVKTHLDLKKNKSSLLKRKVALKLIQHKIETKGLNIGKSKPTKKNRWHIDTIVEQTPNVCAKRGSPKHEESNIPDFTRELYVPLVRIQISNEEETEFMPNKSVSFINDSQPKISIGRTSVSLHTGPSSFTETPNINLDQKFYAPCKVILEQLPLEQMTKYISRKRKLNTSNRPHIDDDIMKNFIPSITSSPYVSPPVSGVIYNTSRRRSETHNSVEVCDEADTVKSPPVFKSLQVAIGSKASQSSSKSYCSENSTYIIKDSNLANINQSSGTSKQFESFFSYGSKVTSRKCNPLYSISKPGTSISNLSSSKDPAIEGSWLNLLEQSSSRSPNIRNLNQTESKEVLKPLVTPKSVLKSNKTKKMSAGNVRRVTFSNTTIIIDDDSDLGSPGTPFRKSFVRLNPSIITLDDSDEENTQCGSSFNKLGAVGLTPFFTKANNSSQFSKVINNNTPKHLILESSKASIKTSKVAKVPNFARLHQNMYDKMLDIKEHAQQQQERARLLLSGRKPAAKPSPNINKSKNQSNNSSKNYSININTTNELSGNRKIRDQSTSKQKVNGLTQFGFKSLSTKKTITRNEATTAVANKSKPLKSTSQIIRTEIKGVRSNRRFELLMQMRLKKK